MNLRLLVFLLVILGFRFYFFHQSQPQLADGQMLSFKTAILSQPQAVGNQQRFTANPSTSLRIKIVASRFPELNYGDFVRISGGISNKNGRVLMYFPEIKPVDNSSGFFQSGLKKINILRQKLILLFSKTLPSPSSGLLLGIIFGVKEQMPKDFSDNLKTSGVFHVIAASGMNVTLVAGFISSFFAFFLKRQIAILLSILGIVFYAVLAGLEPSIIRASIMGTLVFSAQILGRQTLAVNGLSLAGFTMLFIDPTLLVDVGFQLSFAATLGLIYIRPFFERKKRTDSRIDILESGGKPLKKQKLNILTVGVAGDIGTTISAQIATLPILLANFGTYSAYSVLVNGLVLWAVPVLMMIGGIGAILGLILAPLGKLLIYLCYPLLLYFEIIVNFFGKMGGILVINNFSWQFAAGYYSLLISALLFFRMKK